MLLPRRVPATFTDTLLRRLCATLIAAQRLPLADLASALDIAILACREALLAVLPRFVELGCTVTEDATEVALGYVEEVAESVRRVTVLDEDVELSPEQLTILALIAVHGPLTRSAVEEYRGEDAETLLRRLVSKGILARVRDPGEVGGPYVYRLTAKALGLMGAPSIDVLRSRVLQTRGRSSPPRVRPPQERPQCRCPRDRVLAGHLNNHRGRPLRHVQDQPRCAGRAPRRSRALQEGGRATTLTASRQHTDLLHVSNFVRWLADAPPATKWSGRRGGRGR